jgi:hypothetical protein
VGRLRARVVCPAASVFTFVIQAATPGNSAFVFDLISSATSTAGLHVAASLSLMPSQGASHIAVWPLGRCERLQLASESAAPRERFVGWVCARLVCPVVSVFNFVIRAATPNSSGFCLRFDLKRYIDSRSACGSIFVFDGISGRICLARLQVKCLRALKIAEGVVSSSTSCMATRASFATAAGARVSGAS